MEIGLIASRYAKALMEFASERGKVEDVYKDVCALRLALKDNSLMERCIESTCQETRRFLQVVVSNNRTGYLKFILYAFVAQYHRNNDILPANLTMAAESKSLESKLRQLLASYGYTKIEFNSEVNPSLIGGFILQIDDKRFDASLSRQLKTISKEFETRNRKLI